MTENGSIAAPGSNGAHKLSRISLRDQAVHALRTMIVSGAMAGGERINEAELAATLGISRGPLREAIQRVGAEGLIEFRRNRGAFVRKIALEDIEDMYEARVIIEGMAARRAARWATEDQIAELIRDHFPLTPRGIIKYLDMLRPIYKTTASHGHFGRPPGKDGSFSWEKTDKAAALAKAVGLSKS